MPECIGHLLTLVQFLIGYAKECATTLWQHTLTSQVRLTMQARFGTSDLARILIRIGRALRLAAALATRLRRLAATGPHLKTPAERAWVSPSSTLGNRSTTTADRRAAGRGAVPDNLDDNLPNEARIAAMIRRVRAGAVIAEIRRDLGPVPGVVSHQQRSAVHHATNTFGGNYAKQFHDIMLCTHACITAASEASAALSSAAFRHLERAIFESSAPA